jgi:putative hydrolase
MIHIVADLHCHTVASVHAYSTIRENIDAAKRKGLIALAITDHGVKLPEGPQQSFFSNLPSLPEYAEGLRLLRGVEANIMGYNGELDMPESILQKLDFTIASFHDLCTMPGSVEDHTRAYLALAENPYVKIIGHSGTPEFAYDYEKLIPVFKRNGKIVEINAHTFICRQSSVNNCRRIARLCMKYEAPVAVNSDAHSEFELGNFDKALAMLEEIGFPEELIVNSSKERLNAFLRDLSLKPVDNDQEA